MKVELLGKGNMGMVHLDSYQRIQGVEVVSQVGRITPDEVLKAPTIDAVDVCFPSEVHREYVLAALNNKTDVFCETPFALNLDDAEEMIASAKSNERILMVGLLMRSVAEYQEVERRVASGELGKITDARTYRLGNYMTPGSSSNRSHYGDVVSELMTFDIDYLNSLFGLPTTVTATGRNAPDTDRLGEATAVIEYQDVKATAEASAVKPLDFPFSIGIDVSGEKGKLSLKTVFKDGLPETTVTLIKNESEEIIRIDSHDPYEYELRYFAECVDSGKDPGKLSAEKARDALRVVIAIRESIKSAKPQQI